MDNTYNLKRYKLFGKVLYERNRKITNRFCSKADFEISDDLPIYILLISQYPLILKEGYELYLEDNKWKHFAVEIISYSIIEAYLARRIGVIEFQDNTKDILNLFNSINVGLAVFPIKNDHDESFWMASLIDKISSYKKINNNSGSHIDEQLSFFINNIIPDYPKTFRYFSQGIIKRMNENKSFKIKRFIKNNDLKARWYLDKIDLHVEISNKDWKNLQFNLSKRKLQLNSLIEEDRFLSRFFEIIKNSIDKYLSIQYDEADY